MKLPNKSARINSSLFALALLVGCYAPPTMSVLDNATPTIQVLVEIDERWGRLFNDDELDLIAEKVKVTIGKFTIASGEATWSGVVANTAVARITGTGSANVGGKRYLVCDVTLPALAAGMHHLRICAHLSGAVSIPANTTDGSPAFTIEANATPAITNLYVLSTAH